MIDAADNPPPGVVIVEDRNMGPFAERIRTGPFTLRADESAAFGGTDSGPNPYDYLLSALGACTAITLRVYARQKQWPLHKVTVRLRHDRIYAEDCATCETKEGKLDWIDRDIEIEGALDEAQRRKLLQIADRCPVHRTLTSEVLIRTRLA